ncbi:hypothetical protein PAHAL_8G067400 [Panicum hallii]|uniref:Uncharacterized protein n=1 Tax=Panicum hallii TaxID=206008 RepID=A0A2T8I825_9POAL|nr:hypothetical protein PAHAL_8G067400 [Panicum hallii]
MHPPPLPLPPAPPAVRDLKPLPPNPTDKIDHPSSSLSVIMLPSPFPSASIPPGSRSGSVARKGTGGRYLLRHRPDPLGSPPSSCPLCVPVVCLGGGVEGSCLLGFLE